MIPTRHKSKCWLVLAAGLFATTVMASEPPTWHMLTPVDNPQARHYHALAYDATNRQVVLFGGWSYGLGGPLNDTWVWNGTNWERKDTPIAPSPRWRHAMAYDANRGRTVLFGGRILDGPRNVSDTWEWDGSAWVNVTPTLSPPPRDEHAMAFDRVRGKVVLFGGGSAEHRNDTWEWDGNAWTQITDLPQPSGRTAHAMSFDTTRERIVLFGGASASLAILDDTWERNGQTWTADAPQTRPQARFYHAMAFDNARSRTVLFGGWDETSYFEETWEWDGLSWTVMPTQLHPSARRAHAMAFDEECGGVVLFGGWFGSAGSEGTELGDTWVYTGAVGDCQLPTADAGPDQTIDELAVVQLQGSAHDPFGSSLTYSWTQVGGPSVTLDDPSILNPTFAAPSVPAGGAVISFQLVATSSLGNCKPDIVNITVRNINHPPVAETTGDLTVPEGSLVSLNGSPSYDVDDEALTFSWTQTAGTMVTLSGATTATPSFAAPTVGSAGETLTFQLIINDGIVDSVPALVNAHVTNENQAPTATAGADFTANENTEVFLTGSGSDPDQDPLTYRWTQIGGSPVVLFDPTSHSPSFWAPLVGLGGETLTFSLVVNDGLLDSPADQVAVTILNLNDPPSCAVVSASLGQLWPPNHKLAEIGVVGVTDPQGDPITIVITSVTSDEPTDGLGDGDSSPDAVIQSDTVLLRSERSGQGDGRAYVVHFRATDPSGDSCTGFVQVAVPKDMKKGNVAVDSGQRYDPTMP